MKKQIFLFLIVTLFVIGCQPSDSAINTAIAQTQVAVPTNTITPITPTVDITKIKLDPSIFQPEDLGLTGGEIINTLPDIGPFMDLPDVANQLSRKLLSPKNKNDVGWASIIIYKSNEHCKGVLSVIQKNISRVTDKEPKVTDNTLTSMSGGFDSVYYCRENILVGIFISEKQDYQNIEESALTYYIESLITRLDQIIVKQ